MTLIVDPLGRRSDGDALTLRDIREWLESVDAVDADGHNVPDDTIIAIQAKGGGNTFPQAQGFMAIQGIRTVVGVTGDGKPVLK